MPTSSLSETLQNLIKNISEQNYDETLAQYRFWLDLGTVHGHIPQLQVNNDASLITSLDRSVNEGARLIHPTLDLFFRFVGDMENKIIPPCASDYHKKCCTEAVARCFEQNLSLVKPGVGWQRGPFFVAMNLIARWANLGFVEETVIRNHILQSLTSHPNLHDHQAGALMILFKLAGATFKAYVEPSVFDRSFQLLQGHYRHASASSEKRKLMEELVGLRAGGWEDLPPPPVFTTNKPEPTGVGREGPAATPTVISLGLPKGDLEPQVLQPPQLDSVTSPEPDIVHASLATHSPSVSISTLSDITMADTSDDDSPADPAGITPHSTFYLEDGNVEVLCGSTLFRIHTSILSFHSSALHQVFGQAGLELAESPNGCPRIPSSDSTMDFATLLKVVYLPSFPERNKVPDFGTFSSLLRIAAKYELSAVRSQLLDIIGDAYPEAFGGLNPSKPLGESVFTGPTPHPNAVLNLFVQQKLTSALPMAYCMAARRGLDSLMDRRLPRSATLSPEVLQTAVRGLMALREIELKETHRLIFGSAISHPCSSSKCPSRNSAGPRGTDVYQMVVDQITDRSQSGTRILQVLSVTDVCGGDRHGFCGDCVGRWEVGHAKVREKVWAALPAVFGLKG